MSKTSMSNQERISIALKKYDEEKDTFKGMNVFGRRVILSPIQIAPEARNSGIIIPNDKDKALEIFKDNPDQAIVVACGEAAKEIGIKEGQLVYYRSSAILKSSTSEHVIIFNKQLYIFIDLNEIICSVNQ